MKTALITGITGQDGSYLAEILLEKGYTVHGIVRRSSTINTGRIDHLFKPVQEESLFHLHYGDLSDGSSLARLIKTIRPDEIYNLGAMSHVKVSFDIPEYTFDIDAGGLIRILEILRLLEMDKTTRVYQASSSEIFGKVQEVPQKETTPFYPRSPYGVSKLAAYWAAVNYRESYDMFVCNGILFNHESCRRGETFVTRKITKAVAKIANGQQEILYLGNLNAKRDWGHAKDYMRAAWMMLQQETPGDYVIATGQTSSVRDFVQMSFRQIGVEIEFSGTGDGEIGIVKGNVGMYPLAPGREVVKIDKRYHRPAEVDLLIGDCSKAQRELGWSPEYNLKMLVKEMISYEQAFKKRD